MTSESGYRKQSQIAADALARKQAGQEQNRPPNEDSENPGHADTPRPDYPPSGAFDAEGHRPVLERSRKVR